MLNHRIRRIDPSGIITTVAGDGRQGRGPDNVPATGSSLNSPVAVALDSNGDLYIADWQNFLIRKVSFSASAHHHTGRGCECGQLCAFTDSRSAGLDHLHSRGQSGELHRHRFYGRRCLSR